MCAARTELSADPNATYTYHFPQYSATASCKENNGLLNTLQDHYTELNQKICHYSRARFIGGGLLLVAGFMHHAKMKRAYALCIGSAALLVLAISSIAMIGFKRDFNLLTCDQKHLSRVIARQLLGPHELIPQDDSPTSRHLRTVQTEMDLRGIPLHVCPQRPTRQFTFDLAKARAYQNKLDATEQAMLDKLIPLVRCLSIEEFEGTLKTCVDELNAYLAQHHISEYSVAMVAGKSFQWVASLALRFLTVLPTSWFSLSQTQGTLGLRTPKVAKYFESLGNKKTLVLFDDCSWSGNQLIDNLSTLRRNASSHLKLVCVVIPYLSVSALKFATQQIAHFQEKGITLKLITGSEQFKIFNDAFDVKTFQTLNEHHNVVGHCGIAGSQSLFLTQWRYPDGTSFLSGFGSINMTLSETLLVDSNDPGIHKTTDDHGQEEYALGSRFMTKHAIKAYEDPIPLPNGGYRLHVTRGLTPEEYFLPTPQDIERPYGWQEVEA